MKQIALARYLQSFLQPLAFATADTNAESRLLARIGYAAPNGVSLLGSLRAVVDAGLEVAELLADDEGADPVVTGRLVGDVLTALQAVSNTVTNLQGSLSNPARLSSLVTSTDILQTLPRKLFDLLLIDFLARESPATLGVLRLLSIVRFQPITVTGDVNRVNHVSAILAWERLPSLVSAPLAELRAHYGWGTPSGIELPRLFDSLRRLALAFGLYADYRNIPLERRTLVDSALGGAGRVQSDEDAVMLRFPLYPGRSSGFGFDAIPIELGPGIIDALAFDVFADASVAAAVQVTDDVRLTARLAGQASGFALLIRPGQPVTVMTSLSGTNAGTILSNLALDSALGINIESSIGLPMILLGRDNSTRLQVTSVAANVSVMKAQASNDLDLRVEASMKEARLVIRTDSSDGFLAKVLPKEGISLEFDALVGYSLRSGVYFGVGGGAEVMLPMNLTLLDLFTVKAAHLAIKAETKNGKTRVAFEASSNIALTVGLARVEVRKIGLQAQLRSAEPSGNLGPMEAEIGFKPPVGVALRIDAGPVSGSGDLTFDFDTEQYDGMVQLSIKKKIALSAVALITTRLPGLPPGQKGFSLLLIITAEFPPLPLGFGFTLNGIGGLIGINRTMMVEPLCNSVRDRSIEGILFPQNPLANATSLVASLQRIFPPAEGRYVFGPMVKVGWGPTQLITIEAALILELPSPLRLVLLGRMRAVLPDKIAPVVDLRLDIVGVLDFDRGEASVDASFVDSRLAGFTLTGDMALRLGWGATKAFALAAGGFNPRYTPPPSFPVLRRLTLSLGNSDNPRFRLESYLALTSNTIQFGARAELSAKVQTGIGEFGAAAMIFFDALIELDPFGFIVDLGAVIEVTLAGRPLIQAQLMATLSGTKPWHAVGFVEVVFLGRHRIPFEVRVGDQEPTTLPTIKLLDKLIEEVKRPESWTTVPPAEAADVVVLKDSSASGAGLLHPLGTVALRQRLLPFGKRIARFGSAVPEGGAVMFALTGIAVGGRMDAVTPLLDDFAPGQYEALSEDEKLSRPAFERMQAGVETAASLEIRLPNARPGTTTRGTLASIDYEEVVIDRVARPSRQPRRRKKPVLAIGLVAAMADDGVTSDLLFAGPVDRAIAVPGERWREADADHLGSLHGGKAGSAAEAYDRRALSRRPADQTTVIALHEAA